MPLSLPHRVRTSFVEWCSLSMDTIVFIVGVLLDIVSSVGMCCDVANTRDISACLMIYSMRAMHQSPLLGSPSESHDPIPQASGPSVSYKLTLTLL